MKGFVGEVKQHFQPASGRTRGMLVAGVMLAYSSTLVWLYPTKGAGIIALSLLPVSVAGWFFGLWGGLIVALLSFPANALLIQLTGAPGWELMLRGGVSGTATLVLVGTVIGQLRMVSVNLRRELTKRHEAEAALLIARRRLATDGDERTAELQVINEQLRAEMAQRTAAEQELLTSEAQLRTLFENAPDAYYLHDLRGTFIEGNKAAETLVGYPRGELIGQSFLKLNLLPPRQLAKAASLLARNALGKPTGPDQFDLRGKDGSQVAVEIRTRPVKINGRTLVLGSARDITERQLATREIAERRRYLEMVLTAAPDAIITLDAHHHIVEWNAGAERLFGYTRAAVIGQDLDPLITKGAVTQEAATYTRQVMQGGALLPTEAVRYRKDGTPVEVIVAGAPIMLGTELLGVVAVYTDITARKLAEAALRENERRYRQLVKHAPAGIYEIDLPTGQFLSVNDVMCAYTGYTKEEFLALNALDLLTEAGKQQFLGRQQKLTTSEWTADTAEYQIRGKNGREFWVLVNTKLVSTNGKPARAMVVVHDISERKRAEVLLKEAHGELERRVVARTAELQTANTELKKEIAERQRVEAQLQHDAFHDALTGLPNRALFMDRLERACEHAKRRPDYTFAVFFLDFDRFKVINDSLGHGIGDQLLVESSRRLEVCLRTVDTVARLGGDEFVIMLADIQGSEAALQVAERIQKELELPFNLAGHRVFITASLGIVLSAAGYTEAQDILRDADIAMYQAKARGKARYEIFDATMRTQAMARLALETDLRQALANQEFHLHYQPIIALESGELQGFEALLRWQHPTQGAITPGEFIPIAEETGLIIPLGRWVLQAACQQMRQWQVNHPLMASVSISVNLSAKQFMQADLVEQVAEILQETSLTPQSLKLEITESVLMDQAEIAAEVLVKLRDMGVQVQLDDFGTGYSSLSYLHQFPIDTIKIDRSFIGRMDNTGTNGELVETIVMLAHDLGMQAIAEGLETPAQLQQLKALNCEFGQGYHFSKPLPVEAAEQFIVQAENSRVPVV